MNYMFDIHEGSIQLQHSFEEVWNFIVKEGKINLETGKGKAFQARATTAQKGNHRGERVIIFYQGNREFARCYECCWGHYYNCNRTRIGMYCKVLDRFIP